MAERKDEPRTPADEKPTESSGAEAPATEAMAPTGEGPHPAPNVEERIEGVQGWMAEMERKQERMTRFGGAAVLLAVLAAGGALALGIVNQQNSASKDDLEDVENRLDEIQTVVKNATEKQLKSVNESVSAMDQRISALDAQLKQNAKTIATLQSQVEAATAAAGAAGAATGAGAFGGGAGANSVGGAKP